MRIVHLTAVVFIVAACAIASAQSTSFKFVSINYPNSVTTSANGINNYGSIVGAYQASSGGVHGFKVNNGHFSHYDVPGAIATVIQGISDTGDMVGWYQTSDRQYHGFRYHAGVYTKIDVPGATHGTQAMAINKNGTVVGRWLDVVGNYHGFTWVHGAITKFDLNGYATSLNGISNLGVIVGQVYSGDAWRSFLKSGSDVDYLIDPRESDNEAYGVNGHADVVGCAVASGAGYVLYKVEANEGSESNEALPKRVQVAYPGALQTCATGINYNRAIVGTYTDGQQHQQGFLAVGQ